MNPSLWFDPYIKAVAIGNSVTLPLILKYFHEENFPYCHTISQSLCCGMAWKPTSVPRGKGGSNCGFKILFLIYFTYELMQPFWREIQ
jgi:hypothetical protein